MPKEEWKRKRQKEPIEGSKRGPKPFLGPLKGNPKSSARPIGGTARKNLTLFDWMTVYAYVDTLPHPIKQVDVVNYFATRPEGPLIFTQSTLSRKLQHRSEIEARVSSNANALSSKQPRIVTRPDVDRALCLWVQHMERKQEVINSGMLVAKRAVFEGSLNVPENERLTGPGWIQSFCRAHQLKEIRRHGEAGSVNIKTVEEEKARIRELLARFQPKDRWNVDESALFPFAPPDRGLSHRQMSGKRASKFRLTLCFACNADGSQKRDLFFIGKSKKPRCFGRHGPIERGFYYRSNKTAWMTGVLFEEWIQQWDIELQLQNHHIALTLDNFSGHTIQYQPKCITLIYFSPGLTSHVQPLDAGIIRCFKAHYRREFCLRAIQRDNADEEDIYKINLLEAMVMATEAWQHVSPATLENCWNHAGIQRPRLPKITLRHPHPSMPANLAAGWDIVTQFATERWSLPEVHAHLQKRLGNHYIASEWNESLDSVLGAEDDTGAALAALAALRKKWAPNTPSEPCEVAETPDECSEVEGELMDLVAQLKDRRRIFGKPCTLDELLDPEEEREIGENLYSFEGGDTEIIEMVQAEIGLGSEDIEEIDSDDEPEVAPPPLKEVMKMCRILEEYSMVICPQGGFNFVKALREYQGHLQKMIRAGEKQTTLDAFFGL